MINAVHSVGKLLIRLITMLAFIQVFVYQYKQLQSMDYLTSFVETNSEILDTYIRRRFSRHFARSVYMSAIALLGSLLHVL